MRFPLYAKTLGWFLLNLLLLAAGLVIFLEIHFGFGLGALLAGRAGDQVDAASRLILGELRGKPQREWGSVLARYDAVYRVRWSLYTPRGDLLAGASGELPPEIRSEFDGRRPEIPDGPPSPANDNRPPPPPPPSQRNLVKTTNPVRYWALLRVNLPGPPPPRPAVLVIESTSLSAGGLFFDARPWLLAAAGALVLSALWWVPFVRRITRSVGRMADATARFAEGQFSDEVPVRTRDELGELAGSINRMAVRLDGYVSGQRRFLGDIAHELCAPLARMQMALGILEERADESQRERLLDLREEADQMSSLVNELLSFSKAALGGNVVQRRNVEVRSVAERAAQREGAGRIEIDVPPNLSALADPNLLERALANLLRNALRYAGDFGPITVGGKLSGDTVVVTVRDGGPGVPDEMLEKVFDPFFRVDSARTRESGGVGLGLAIVQTCVASCGGSVVCQNLHPSGFEVTIRLPAGT